MAESDSKYLDKTGLQHFLSKLDDRYLSKSGKASDSDKLDGQDSTYYLNYNNLTNKPTIPATNIIPSTSTANKVLLSTTTGGTAAWSSWSSAGFLKTNTSGVVSVDTTKYLPLNGGTLSGPVLSSSYISLIGGGNSNLYIGTDDGTGVQFNSDKTINLLASGTSSATITLPSSSGRLALTSELPTVNNGTLTIQNNGTTINTFTANSSSNITANIITPQVKRYI